MYKQMINLAPGETLQLDWDKNYANFSIYLNGQPVGSFPDKSSLKLGHRFNLPGDGQRQITVILAEQGLQVWYNGIDIVSGMKSGDSDHFDNAAKY
ncbi:MAG: hypothetical protein LH618_05015, partial [Saprospiraceae bacterium]|nr:hypothetical protein [Saprospiraceae bacterium]